MACRERGATIVRVKVWGRLGQRVGWICEMYLSSFGSVFLRFGTVSICHATAEVFGAVTVWEYDATVGGGRRERPGGAEGL